MQDRISLHDLAGQESRFIFQRAIDRLKILVACRQQRLETVDREIGMLKIVDPVVGLHHPLQVEGGIKRVVNGPIPFTPDGLPLIGPMPGVPNAFEACVFSFGIVQAGGAGKLCADLIVEGEPETDSWAMDPRRFTDHADSAYATAKAVEVYSNEYAMHFPQMQSPAGRPAKTSPLFETLQAKGAEFGAYGGWERADWFPEDGEAIGPARSYLRPHWFERVDAECRHVAEHAGVLDLTGFSRFEVTGDGAAAWLDGLITGKLARPGCLGLVYCASPRGKTVTQMSLTRFDENRFWLMTAAGALWHDRDWLVQRLPADGSVQIEDVTRQWGTLLVTGPKSRGIISAAVSDLDLSTGAFSWLTHQPLDTLGGHLLRVSFAGELGLEFHVPMDRLKETYDMIMDAGSDHDLRDFGMLALKSMRLEKGYRSWKGGLTGDYSMFENGLGRWVDHNKPDFVGREALMANRDAGVTQDFATFVVDAAEADAPALSTVWDGDRKAGLVLSGGCGHRTKKSIACASSTTHISHREPRSKSISMASDGPPPLLTHRRYTTLGRSGCAAKNSQSIVCCSIAHYAKRRTIPFRRGADDFRDDD